VKYEPLRAVSIVSAKVAAKHSPHSVGYTLLLPVRRELEKLEGCNSGKPNRGPVFLLGRPLDFFIGGRNGKKEM